MHTPTDEGLLHRRERTWLHDWHEEREVNVTRGYVVTIVRLDRAHC
jgi:hypothetical protein